MKEAFWGVLVVMLGLLGIVIIQVFQNITVTNDQTYYLLKEVTEASMLDSIDLAYYRTKGKIKILEEKFVENFARRFGESANLNRDYNIIVHDVIEEPPKVSLSIGANVFSLKGDEFNIGQSLNSIIEAKYDGELIGESTVETDEDEDEEEHEKLLGEDVDSCPVCEPGDPNCNPVMECIPGDLRFISWEPADIDESMCPEDAPKKLVNKPRIANYERCDCGTWKAQIQSETSVITQTKSNYTYTWKFVKSTPIRTIDVSTTEQGIFDKCVDVIVIGGTNVDCPNGKRIMQKGKSIMITPTYIPGNAVNRGLNWTSSDIGVATVQYPIPDTVGPKGTSIATVTGIKKGHSIITAQTTNNKTDTCDVEVIDPVNDGWSCPSNPLTMPINSAAQATIKGNIKVLGMTWKVTNTNIATIDKNTGKVKSKNSPTEIKYIVNAPGFDELRCRLIIRPDEDPNDTGSSSVCTPGSISVKWDIKKEWPNKKGPKLCPQDFEIIRTCKIPPYPGASEICTYERKAVSKLGMSDDKVSYCGYKGGYKYPEKATWDKTEIKNSSFIVNGEEKLDEKKHTYSVTFTHTFDYEWWNTAVGPYTTGINEISKMYTINGELYDRNNSNCKADSGGIPTVFINECPTGGIVNGTSAIQLLADRDMASLLDDSTAKWSSNNSDILKITSTNNDPLSVKVKGVGVGTATITYSIKRKDTKEILKANCTIDVFPECKKLRIVGPSTILRTDTKTYSIDPSLGGESSWTSSNSNIIRISDQSKYKKDNDIKGINVGKANIKIERRLDNCKKELSVTVKQKLECPKIDGFTTKEYEFDSNLCYTRYKKAPFVCSSDHPYSGDGWCFYNYYDWYRWRSYRMSVSKEKPESCDFDRAGMVYSLGYCCYLYPKVIAVD